MNTIAPPRIRDRHRYLGQWNPSMDLDIAPVLNDEETAAAAKSIVADNRA